MNLLRILIFLLIFNNFILLGFLFSQLTGNAVKEKISANITRVTDGDTFDSSIGKVRLLGINAPEKSQQYYEEAKENLKKYEGKIVEIETANKDKYSRTLAYVFYKGTLINKEQLEMGLANLYYYDKDEYYSSMSEAERLAREKSRGIWKHSGNYGCIKLIKLNYLDFGNLENQEQLILNNICEKMNIIIKDEANHIYEETINSGIWTKNFTRIWNDEGDTLIIRDNSGLILFYRYS